ncbi:MAG: acyltransferase family protein [Hyphomicrobium sp.]
MSSVSVRTIVPVQGLRGLAALAVVVSHLHNEFTRSGVAIASLAHGQVGVDIFFVISGFIIVYASEGLFGKPDAARRFAVRRAGRILPIYWMVTLALVGFWIWRFGNAGAASEWPTLIGSFLLLPIGGRPLVDQGHGHWSSKPILRPVHGGGRPHPQSGRIGHLIRDPRHRRARTCRRGT